MNHFMNGFAGELTKTSEKKIHKYDVTLLRGKKYKPGSKGRTSAVGGLGGALAGLGISNAANRKLGNITSKKLMAIVGVAGLAGALSGYRAGSKTQRASILDLKLTKTSAFPQHEAKDAPYDTASSTAKTMETTQGASSKTGLKGGAIQTAPGLSKKAPTPLTTPNFMVDG